VNKKNRAAGAGKTFESEPLPFETHRFVSKKFFAPLFFKKAAAFFDLI
jgi:hypothetical protein